MIRTTSLYCGLLAFALFFINEASCDTLSDKPSDELFGIGKLWTIHLRVDADEWEKIEPEDAGGFPGGPPPFRGGPQANNSEERPEPRDRNDMAPGNRVQGERGRGRRGPGPGGMMRGVKFPYVHADFEFEGMTVKNVAIRYKGQASFMMARNSPKKSFKIDFNRYKDNQEFFQLKKLNLNNNTMDPSQMVDSLSYDLFRAFQIPAPRTAHAKVYLTVEGQQDRKYLGVYTIVEQIDDDFLKRNFDRKSGLLLKPQMIPGFPYYGNDWEDYEVPYEPKSDNVTWKQAKHFMAFTELVNDASDEEFAQNIETYTDVVQFLRFLAVNVVISNYDSILGMGQNYYIYRDPDLDRFLWIPWDCNLAFGKFPMGGSNYQQMKASINEPLSNTQPLIDRILKIPEWKDVYLKYVREFTEDVFLSERVCKNVDAMHALIKTAVEKDPNVSFEKYMQCVSNDPIEKSEGMGFPFGGPRGRDRNSQRSSDNQENRGDREFRGGPPMMGGAFSLVSWTKGRRESVIEQLDGKSEGVKLSRGMGPGSRGPGGPGGFGPDGPGGPGGFGPGMFLGPQLMTVIDQNEDGTISAVEYENQYKQWSKEWDKDADAVLSQEELTNGLSELFKPPEDMPFGPPGGFSPGMFLVSSFLNNDNETGLNRNDFETLWKEWFTKWDGDNSNDLEEQEIVEGLNGIIRPPRGFMGGPPRF